jgi:AhpC/TSA family protein
VLMNLCIGLLWVLAIVQGAVIVALVHQLADLRVVANSGAPALPKLPVGVRAPEFSALDLQSNGILHSSTFNGRRTVLCFMNADCHVCRVLAFELSQKPADVLEGLVVYYDSVAASAGEVFQSLAEKIPVLCEDTVELSTQFGLEKFPVAVVIDEAWRISATNYPLRADDILASLSGPAEPAPASTPALTPLAGQS